MAASRKERQSTILHIVSGEVISSQKVLLQKLHSRGLKATQATVSRDIRELGLVKVASGTQGYRYLPRGEGRAGDSPAAGGVVNSISSAGHLLVARTQPGYAQSVAAAIDALGWKEFLGTVGGDDTVIIVVKNPQAAAGVKKRLCLFFSPTNDKKY